MSSRARLAQLDPSGATNGQVARYNSTSGNWEPATLNVSVRPLPKSGTKLKEDFSGNPKTATVTFATPFADTDYAITLAPGTTGNAGFGPVWNSKTANGFVINMGVNNVSRVVAVDWTAVKNGET